MTIEETAKRQKITRCFLNSVPLESLLFYIGKCSVCGVELGFYWFDRCLAGLTVSSNLVMCLSVCVYKDCVDDIHSSGQVKRTERQGGLNIEHCFQPETWKAFFQLVTSGQLVDDDVQQEQYRDSRSVFVPTLLHTLVENTNLLNEECHNSLPRLPMGSGQLMITTLPEYVARTMLSAALQNAADCRKKLNFCEVVNPGAAAPPASSYVILAMARSTGAFLINVCDVMHHLVGASRFCSQEYRSAMSNATDTGMRVAHHLLVLGWALKLSWKLRQRLCQELKHFENVAEEVSFAIFELISIIIFLGFEFFFNK